MICFVFIIVNLIFCANLIFAQTYVLKPVKEEKQISLRQAINLARQKNEDLQISQNSVKKANTSIIGSRASLLPRVNLSGQYSLDQSSKNAIFGNKPHGFANASWSVFDLSVLAKLSCLKANRQAASYAHEYFLQKLIFDVSQAYIDASSKKELLNKASSQLKSSNLQVASLERLVKVGQKPKVDFNRASLLKLKAREKVKQAQVTFKYALGNLGFLIGVEHEFDLVKTKFTLCESYFDYKYHNSCHCELDPESKPIILDKESKLLKPEILIKKALNARSDYKAQQNLLKSAQYRKSSIHREYIPKVSINGQIGVGPKLSNENEFGLKTGVSLSVSLPLFEGGARIARYQEAKLLSRDEKLGLEKLKRQIESQVLGVLTDINLKTKELALAKKALETLQDISNSVQNRYKAGLVSSFELINSELELFKAQSALIVADASFAKSLINMQFVTGQSQT